MNFFKNRKANALSPRIISYGNYTALRQTRKDIYLFSSSSSIIKNSFPIGLPSSQLLRCSSQKFRIVVQSTVGNTIIASGRVAASGQQSPKGFVAAGSSLGAKPNKKTFNKNRGLINDSISDMLTRVRNACLAKKANVIIPYTQPNQEIAQILEKEGFIQNFQVSLEAKDLILRLKYRSTQIYKGKTKECCITNLRRISKPGLRIYSNSREIPRILGGTGIVIISTPNGIMTDREARLQGIGGELLCSVW